mmetsp:Transcript_23082/g.39040  ORF Transcript_23082/g.39040 Transcript_23082/m.39040 type:complete len:191 (+) Transcript_23082:150-722(+)
MLKAQQSVLKAAAKTVLDQKLNILRAVSQQDYVHVHTPHFNASVGGHIRHSLDHFSILLSRDFAAASPLDVVDYDIRDRNTDIETNKDSAIAKTCALLTTLDDMFASPSAAQLMATPLTVRFVGDAASGETYSAPTSLAREMSFVAHHGIHHLATVKLMMQRMNYELGDGVGKAFATIQHEQEQQAATKK